MHKVDIKNGKVVQGELLTYYGKDLLGSAHEASVLACLAVEDGVQNQTPSLAREILVEGLPISGGGADVILRYFDGRCGNWAEFMTEVVKTQGFDASVRNIRAVNGYAFKVDPTIKGQGNAIPRENVWPDHATVFYNGTIYDPSYGVCYGDVSTALDELAKNIVSVGIYDISKLKQQGLQYTGFISYTTDTTITTTAEKRAKIVWH
ncbi:MAG: hypothetical protein Q4D38_09945 [Planctomycetia bacterium]|nr:hypothetical protein [Planctomycetia bacterium]